MSRYLRTLVQRVKGGALPGAPMIAARPAPLFSLPSPVMPSAPPSLAVSQTPPPAAPSLPAIEPALLAAPTADAGLIGPRDAAPSPLVPTRIAPPPTTRAAPESTPATILPRPDAPPDVQPVGSDEAALASAPDAQPAPPFAPRSAPRPVITATRPAQPRRDVPSAAPATVSVTAVSPPTQPAESAPASNITPRRLEPTIPRPPIDAVPVSEASGPPSLADEPVRARLAPRSSPPAKVVLPGREVGSEPVAEPSAEGTSAPIETRRVTIRPASADPMSRSAAPVIILPETEAADTASAGPPVVIQPAPSALRANAAKGDPSARSNRRRVDVHIGSLDVRFEPPTAPPAPPSAPAAPRPTFDDYAARRAYREDDR